MNKVAIITRTKDRPVFLKRALESVAEQSYGDYVHVIVNDGGGKSFIESLLEGMTDNQRQKTLLFHRDVSSGAPDTIFNESIDRVDSEFIAIHDDDDTWHPDFLKETMAILETGAKGVVVRTDKVIESVKEDKIKIHRTIPYLPDMTAVGLYRQCIDNQLTPISFIYRRSVYREIGGYDSSLPVVGDWEFGLRFLKKYDVSYHDPGYALAYYHHRGGGDNSFAKHNHRKYVTQVANNYLREDLSNGTLGLGYIMSKLKYDQDIRHGLAKMLLPKSILSMIKK